MAHTLGTTVLTRTSAATSPITRSATTVGADTCLVLSIKTVGATDRAGGAPTFNGVAGTQANITQKAAASPEAGQEVWYWANPLFVGTADIVIPNTGALTIFSSAYTGRAASGFNSAFDVAAGSNNTAADPTTGLMTTTVNGAIIFAFTAGGWQTFAPTARTGTSLYEVDDGAHGGGGQYLLQATAGAQAMSWTFGTSEDWGAVGVAFKEVPHPSGEVSTNLPSPSPLSMLAALTIAGNLLQSTLAPVPPPPFAQNEWPNPRLAGISAPTIAGNLLQSTLAPIAAKPFNQNDWPNPERRGSLVVTHETLPADDVLIAFKQSDWPLPSPRPFLRHNGWTLDGLRVAQDPAPQVPDAWPLPVLRPASPSGSTESTPRTLHGQDQFYGAPGQTQVYDWPNPRLPVLAPQTWTQSPPVPDAVAAAPFTPTDYPQPRGKDHSVDLRTWTQNLQQSTLQPAGASPFIPGDFPNPQARPAATDLRTWIETRKSYYVDLTPANQYDWPNPQSAGRVLDLRTATVNLQQTTLVPNPDPPFVPESFDNPRGRATVITQRTWTTGRQSYHVDLQPAKLTEWPNPAVKRLRELTTWTQNLQESTLEQPVPVVPIAWEVPRGKSFPVALRTALDSRKPYHVDLTPTHQTDWPNPLVAPVAVDIRTCTTTIVYLAAAELTAPVSKVQLSGVYAASVALDGIYAPAVTLQGIQPGTLTLGAKT